MTVKLFTTWNLECVEEIVETIKWAFTQRHGLTNARPKLLRLRDELDELVRSIGYTGDDESAESWYHHLFDGLAWLNAGIRTRACLPFDLRQACTALERALDERRAA